MLVTKHPALEVVHQAGRGHEAGVEAAYAREGFARARVTPFIEDTASAIANADIVVARAGAITIAEVCAVGRPLVLIPLPHAADDHQTKNAEEVARAGAAVWLRQDAADARTLADCLDRILTDDGARKAMAREAQKRGRPHAAREVAADLLALARVSPREQLEDAV